MLAETILDVEPQRTHQFRRISVASAKSSEMVDPRFGVGAPPYLYQVRSDFLRYRLNRERTAHYTYQIQDFALLPVQPAILPMYRPLLLTQ